MRIGIQIISNRQDYLPVLLSSLHRQTYRFWDLIIVSPSPIINSHIVVSQLARMQFEGHRVYFLEEEKTGVKGIGALRNLALNNDKNPIGVRIDDDSWCEPDYLERLVTVLLKEPKAGCVGGLVPTIGAEKIYKLFENLGWINEFGDMEETFPTAFYNVPEGTYTKVKHLRSSFMYLNERMREIGGFPTDYDKLAAFREESDACLRMVQKGYENFFVPQAVAWHFNPNSGGTREDWSKLGMTARLEADTLFRRKFAGKI